MFQEIVQIFSSPTATAVSFVVGVLGAAYGLYARGKNPITKRIYFRSKGANIVNKRSKDIPSLEIRYDGADIKVLSETIVQFWNSGNAGIGPNDIPAAAPIAIQVPEGEQILACRVVKADGPGVDFAIPAKLGGHTAPLSVSSIERGKGALLEILHTATEPSDARLVGVITDYGPPKRVTPKITIRRIVTGLDTLTLAALFAAIASNTWRLYKTEGLGAAIVGFLLVGLVLLLIFAFVEVLIEKIIYRIRKHTVSPSTWLYECDELTANQLKRAGEKIK